MNTQVDCSRSFMAGRAVGLVEADSSAVGIFHSGELLLVLTELDQRVEKLLSTMSVTIEMNKVGGIRNCDQPFDRCMHQVSN